VGNTLQDFTVLPTDIFRQCVIRSSSVNKSPTSSPTDYVRRLSFRRWFLILSLYRSEQKKPFVDGFTDGICAPKKIFPLEIYRRIFISSVISWLTDGYKPSVNLSVSVWNTDRIYPYVKSSVSVAATVKCWQIKSVDKFICEWLKYRRNIFVCKGIGECYC